VIFYGWSIIKLWSQSSIMATFESSDMFYSIIFYAHLLSNLCTQSLDPYKIKIDVWNSGLHN